MKWQMEAASSSLSRRAPQPFFENIPIELSRLNRWLCWHFSEKPRSTGKIGKVPFNIADRRADITDPKQLLPFETAKQQYLRGQYDGIGIVLGAGLCGVDFDHCVADDLSLIHI